MLYRSTLMSAVSTLMLVAGCSSSSDPAEPQEAELSHAAVSGEESEQTAAPSKKTERECISQVLSTSAGFYKDLEASVDPKYVSNQAGKRVIHIPGALVTLSGGEDGPDQTFTPIMWDIAPHHVDFSPAPGIIASISSSAVHGDPSPRSELSKRLGKAANALFKAMTRVDEIKTNHVAAPDTFDHSWTRVTRSSLEGRLTCTHGTDFYQDGSVRRHWDECEVSDLESAGIAPAFICP